VLAANDVVSDELDALVAGLLPAEARA
jgi:hypothetical protein